MEKEEVDRIMDPVNKELKKEEEYEK